MQLTLPIYVYSCQYSALQHIQGSPTYKECLLHTSVISHSQNIGIEKCRLFIPVSGTCQHYAKLWHYQKYSTVASTVNWNLTVRMPSKQNTDTEVEGNMEQCWPHRVFFQKSISLDFFKFRFLCLLPGCKLSDTR